MPSLMLSQKLLGFYRKGMCQILYHLDDNNMRADKYLSQLREKLIQEHKLIKRHPFFLNSISSKFKFFYFFYYYYIKF